MLVVGAGNAAMCAALSAREAGASVIMLERANEAEAGGNTRYTAGAMRFAHAGADDVATLVDLSAEELDLCDFGEYTEEQFTDDMLRNPPLTSSPHCPPPRCCLTARPGAMLGAGVTQQRTDPELCEKLVSESLSTMQWLRAKGMKFLPSYGRQAFKVDGKFRFWGGLCVEVWGGGPGIWEQQEAMASAAGIEIRYDTRADALLFVRNPTPLPCPVIPSEPRALASCVQEEGRVLGVETVSPSGERRQVRAGSVVMAAGGFEANSRARAQHLGPGWELAKVRGTRHNQGEGIEMALAVG